jgi:hypothetical protein
MTGWVCNSHCVKQQHGQNVSHVSEERKRCYLEDRFFIKLIIRIEVLEILVDLNWRDFSLTILERLK